MPENIPTIHEGAGLLATGVESTRTAAGNTRTHQYTPLSNDKRIFLPKFKLAKSKICWPNALATLKGTTVERVVLKQTVHAVTLIPAS